MSQIATNKTKITSPVYILYQSNVILLLTFIDNLVYQALIRKIFLFHFFTDGH